MAVYVNSDGLSKFNFIDKYYVESILLDWDSRAILPSEGISVSSLLRSLMKYSNELKLLDINFDFDDSIEKYNLRNKFQLKLKFDDVSNKYYLDTSSMPVKIKSLFLSSKICMGVEAISVGDFILAIYDELNFMKNLPAFSCEEIYVNK